MHTFIIDERIPADRVDLFKEEAVRALSIFKKEREERNKKLYKLECAIGTLYGMFKGPHVVACWNFRNANVIEIKPFE